jgi:hypothetical protein
MFLRRGIGRKTFNMWDFSHVFDRAFVEPIIACASREFDVNRPGYEPPSVDHKLRLIADRVVDLLTNLNRLEAVPAGGQTPAQVIFFERELFMACEMAHGLLADAPEFNTASHDALARIRKLKSTGRI